MGGTPFQLGFAAIALALVGVAQPARAVEYVNDPLTSASHPGRGSKGGTFSASGWTTKNSPTASSQDSVWYEIDAALPSASIEVTVTGLQVGTTLAGNDHDLLVIYQAPTGQAEPVKYLPYFRNNDFKAFLRIFGSKETDRPGAMKLELAACPLGEPWYDNGPCPDECKKAEIAYANGQDKDIGWNATTAYTLRLEWAPGIMRFFRNGKLLGDVNFDGTYAPKPLRVRIGSPRNDGVSPGKAYMPAPLTFRDVRIDGTPGEMTPVCEPSPVVPPDAGESVDAGVVDSGCGSDPLSLELPVVQDVTASSYSSGVFSDVTDLNVSGNADGTPESVGYLRFAAIDGVVDKALLRLRAHDYSSASGGSGVICRVNDDSWQESTLSWQNRPPIDESACAGSSVSVVPGQDVEWDITSLIVEGQTTNLAIVSVDANGTHLMSKEASAAFAPRLLVEKSCSEPGGAGGSGGTNGWPDAAGASGGALGGGDPARGETAEDPGCACRTSATTASGRALSLLALVLVAAGRRRRKGRNR